MIVVRVDGSHYISEFNSFCIFTLKDEKRAFDFGTMQKALDFIEEFGDEFDKIEILKEVNK